MAENNGRKRLPPSKAWPLIKRFWPWVRPHMHHVWVMIVLLLVSTPLPMAAPLIIRRVVDDAVQEYVRRAVQQKIASPIKQRALERR